MLHCLSLQYGTFFLLLHSESVSEKHYRAGMSSSSPAGPRVFYMFTIDTINRGELSFTLDILQYFDNLRVQSSPVKHST